MRIKDFILRAMEYDPITEATAQKLLQRILKILGYGMPKELPDSKEQDP